MHSMNRTYRGGVNDEIQCVDKVQSFVEVHKHCSDGQDHKEGAKRDNNETTNVVLQAE